MGQSYRDLIARQKAMALVTDVYLAPEDFPARSSMASPPGFEDLLS